MGDRSAATKLGYNERSWDSELPDRDDPIPMQTPAPAPNPENALPHAAPAPAHQSTPTLAPAPGASIVTPAKSEETPLPPSSAVRWADMSSDSSEEEEEAAAAVTVSAKSGGGRGDLRNLLTQRRAQQNKHVSPSAAADAATAQMGQLGAHHQDDGHTKHSHCEQQGRQAGEASSQVERTAFDGRARAQTAMMIAV